MGKTTKKTEFQSPRKQTATIFRNRGEVEIIQRLSLQAEITFKEMDKEFKKAKLVN